MIQMDVSHDSERCSHDFRQILAAFSSNRHLFPPQYDITLLLYMYIINQSW